jgi:hypothetical protein
MSDRPGMVALHFESVPPCCEPACYHVIPYSRSYLSPASLKNPGRHIESLAMADQGIDSNHNIAGIGVSLFASGLTLYGLFVDLFPQICVNFYVTILLTALTPKNKYTTDLLDGLYKSAILYGLALNITAVIQAVQNQMDLYHALYVMYNLISLEFAYVCGMVLRSVWSSFSRC